MSPRLLCNILVEFGPLVAFFVVASVSSFMAGVAALLISTVLFTALSLLILKHLPHFSLLTSVVVVVFSALSLISSNGYWIVFEYTAYNAGFAIALIVGLTVFKTSLLKLLFNPLFAITERGWRTLTWRWSIMFLLTAIGNEYIWHIYGPDIWVQYRLIASVALIMFGVSQFSLSRRERLPEANAWGLRL